MSDNQSNIVPNEPDVSAPMEPPVRRRGRKKASPGVTTKKVVKSRWIFVLDDSDAEVAAISAVLEAEGMFCKTFTNPKECIDSLRSCACDVLVTDLKMPEMDGMDVLIEARKICPGLPVVVITGYGNISLAVVAMKNGATNFIEKPFDATALLDSIKSAMDDAQRVWSSTNTELSAMEQLVLKHILQGNGNRHIALMTGKSVRTIEDQRGHLMRKLGVVNVVDLVKRCIALGLV
jgi:two-component system, LuxR family, response regulator FixJ